MRYHALTLKPTPLQQANSGQPHEHNQGDEKEESLTTLLNEEQRGQLTLLIASAMAIMRKTINAGFDANVRGLCCSLPVGRANRL